MRKEEKEYNFHKVCKCLSSFFAEVKITVKFAGKKCFAPSAKSEKIIHFFP
jgi:hypothetical protein